MLDWWKSFSKREKGAVVGGFLFSVIWGVVVYHLGPEEAPKMGESVSFLYQFNEWGAVLALTLAGLYATYAAVQGLGGSLGRGVAVVGVGYIGLALLQIPHAVWHGNGTHNHFFVNQIKSLNIQPLTDAVTAVLGQGLTVGGLDIFFHVFTGAFALYMAYGFYLTYKASKGGGGL